MTVCPRKIVVMIPTFNEADDVQALLGEILALPLAGDLRILVVDDNSPDGTAELVRIAAADDARVRLLLRTTGKGRGAAGIAGFKAALDLGADIVVEMDGDFSHQPRFIPALVEEASRCDVAIGSRFARGGADSDRAAGRRAITWLVRGFIRLRFRTSVRDVSSGFRAFRRDVLERLDLDAFVSTGPSIVLEILYKLILMGASIHEVPIEFIDRRRGRTKLSGRILVKTLRMALKFRGIYGPPPKRGRAGSTPAD